MQSARRFPHPLAPLAVAVHLALPLLATGWTAPAAAQSDARDYDIPAGPLADALNRFAQQAGVALVVDASAVEGQRTGGLRGRYGVEAGFAELLRGSGHAAGQTSAGYVLVPARPAAAPPAPAQAPSLPVVKVRAAADGDALPATYPGGQVARGARIGLLGNGDFMETPASVVAFTADFRDNLQALSVSDMLKYSVSAQTPQAGAMPTTDVIYVRGFNIGTYDGTFDGLPGLLGRMPPVEAVERVELLLGANSFANGQPSSTGGNINIVPKRAGSEPLYRVGATYRTESIAGGTVDVGQRFGPDQAVGLRVNAAYADGDTELTDGRRRAFSRAVALDHRTDVTRLTFDYMGNDRRLPAETWFVVNPGVAMPDPDRASRDFRQPWTYYKDAWDAAVLRGEWDFATDWTVSAAYGRMWNKVERFSQVSEVTNDAGDMVDAWGGTFGHSKQRRTGYAGELVVRGELKTGPVKHRPRLGVTQYGEKSGYDAVYDNGNPFASNIYAPVHYPTPALAGPAMPSGYDSRTRNRGLFLSDEMLWFDDRLRVLIGARQVEYRSESLDGATGAWGGDPARRKWSPAFGVLFRAQPWLSLYANRLEALEPGYRVQFPAANEGEVLPPLPATQVEVGAKADFGTMAVTAAWFDIDKPSYFLDATTGIEGANGRQVNRGLELSAFGQAMPGLRVYGSATWINPKMKKTVDGTYDGKVAVSAARVLANVYADWDVPMAPGLGLLGGVSHSGSVWNDEANTQKLDAWTRVDAGVRYRFTVGGRSATVRFTVDNLLDTNYFVSERGTIYFAPGRTLGLAVTADL